MMPNTPLLHANKENRRGTTTVEFALTAPFLFLIVFASIEFSRANMLLHSATAAASEGARRGIISGTTAGDIAAVVERELSAIGVSHSNVIVDPPVVTDGTTLVTVGVAVPVDHRNGYVLPQFFLGKRVTKVVAMPREAKKDPQMTQRIADACQRVSGQLDSVAVSP